MRISDWSSDVCSSDLGEMCGNGARCVARRAAELGLVKDRAAFATGAGLIRATIAPDRVTLAMTQPNDERPAVTLEFDGRRSEEHTSELQSLMRISSAVFCL